jgi:hypothetical protein
MRLSSAQSRFLPREPGSSHRPPVSRTQGELDGKMEERPRAPSVVSVTLRAYAHARGVSATRTQRLATPDTATHHASSVTIRRDACAPFRYVRRFHPTRLRSVRSACAPHRPARRKLVRFRDEPPSPASADSMACSGLDRPSTACLATRREGRPRCVPTDFCFPLLSTTSTRASSVPSISSKLALRPWPMSLHPEPGDWETWHFTMPDLLRWAVRIGAWRFLPRTSERAEPLTPLSPPAPPAALSRERARWAAETAELDPP